MTQLRKRIERLERSARATYDHEEAMAYWKARGQHLGRKIQAFFHGIPYEEEEPPERPDFLPEVTSEEGEHYKELIKDRLMRLKQSHEA